MNVTVLADNLDIRVLDHDTGQLIRKLSRESNPLVYQEICLLSGSFVPSRSGSVPLVTCGFVLGS
jgi:hypothetical protein